MQDHFQFLRRPDANSCRRFFAFSRFFGRGVQVEKGMKNDRMYLKTGEAEIEW